MWNKKMVIKFLRLSSPMTDLWWTVGMEAVCGRWICLLINFEFVTRLYINYIYQKTSKGLCICKYIRMFLEYYYTWWRDYSYCQKRRDLC